MSNRFFTSWGFSFLPTKWRVHICEQQKVGIHPITPAVVAEDKVKHPLWVSSREKDCPPSDERYDENRKPVEHKSYSVWNHYIQPSKEGLQKKYPSGKFFGVINREFYRRVCHRWFSFVVFCVKEFFSWKKVISFDFVRHLAKLKRSPIHSRCHEKRGVQR